MHSSNLCSNKYDAQSLIINMWFNSCKSKYKLSIPIGTNTCMFTSLTTCYQRIQHGSIQYNGIKEENTNYNSVITKLFFFKQWHMPYWTYYEEKTLLKECGSSLKRGPNLTWGQQNIYFRFSGINVCKGLGTVENLFWTEWAGGTQNKSR